MSEHPFVTVHVTAADIEGANPSAHTSPIARAIRRRLSRPQAAVAVWIGRVWIDGKCYHLPTAVDNADTEFTRTGIMAPFSFRLFNECVPCHADHTRDTTNQRPSLKIK